MSAPFFEAMAC